MFISGTDSPEDEVARQVVKEYGFSLDAECKMINLSENATYLIDDPATGRGGILRVHRSGYHTHHQIESELDWLDALNSEHVLDASTVIPAPDGRRIVSTVVAGQERHAVLFETMGGWEPDEAEVNASDFRTLGRLTARLHRHAISWRRPPAFHRFSWDWQHTLGEEPRWGSWKDGIGVGPAEIAAIQPAVDLVESRLRAYGTTPDRYGLVHADLRLANLLVDGDTVNVIDFDDAGLSWFMYDFGTAVSFIEDYPNLPALQSAWLEGYRQERELSVDDVDMLATFVMLRRLLLVAWMGSHSHSLEAQQKGPTFTAGTCELAARYLRSGGASL